MVGVGVVTVELGVAVLEVGVAVLEVGVVVLEVGMVIVEVGAVMVVGLVAGTVIVGVQGSNSQGWQAVTGGEGPLAVSSTPIKEYSRGHTHLQVTNSI